MHISQKTNQQLLAIYDAAYAPERVSAAMDSIKFGTDAIGSIVWARGFKGAIEYQRNMGCSNYLADETILANYNKRFVDGGPDDIDTEGARKIHAMPFGVPVFDADLFDMVRFEKLPQVQYMREVAGLGARVHMNISLDPAISTGLILNYDRATHLVPDNDVSQLKLLAPHIAKSIDLLRWGDSLRSKYNALLGVLDKIDIGVALTDSSGRVVFANAYADAILQAREGLSRDRHDYIRAPSEDVTNQISEAISKITATAFGEGNDTVFELPISRGEEKAPLLLICSPLRDANMEIEKHLVGCLITIVDPDRPSDLKLDLFGQTYGLTPTEVKVVPLLVAGLRTPEIAEELGVAASTVASHVKAIMLKTGSKGRVGLVWKAIQFSPPVF